MDGISLLPLIEGAARSRGASIAFQCPDSGDRGRESRLGSPDHALIGDRYKFLSYLDEERAGEDMLFDLVTDPGERHNLAGQLPDLAASMKSELVEWDLSCSRSDEGADYPVG